MLEDDGIMGITESTDRRIRSTTYEMGCKLHVRRGVKNHRAPPANLSVVAPGGWGGWRVLELDGKGGCLPW